MQTKFDPSFLAAIVLMTDFKPGDARRVKSALLAMAVNGLDFTAADLPAEIANGDIHIAGAACGALVCERLIVAVDRRKSPDPKAKGRKLNVYRLAMGKLETARAWFRAQKLTPPSAPTNQVNLIAA
jgi:hypothetical protein